MAVISLSRARARARVSAPRLMMAVDAACVYVRVCSAVSARIEKLRFFMRWTGLHLF